MIWSRVARQIERAAPGGRLALRNLRVPRIALPQDPGFDDRVELPAVDLLVEAGRIASIGPTGTGGTDGIDLEGRMVWPAPIDCHTHIDKGQVWPRGPNPDGSFDSALEASGADLATWQTAEDVRRRSEFSLASAYAHGTALLRTHVDATPERFDERFGVLTELAQDWAGRIEVQLCPFSGVIEDPDWLLHLARAAQATPIRTLSFFLQSMPGLDVDLDRIVGFAMDHDLNLDFHADENLDPASDCLDTLARALIRHRFERPVLVGHCCALSVQEDDTVSRTLDRVAQTGIGIVALPLCNTYLQDRHPTRAPRQRGIAPLKEIRARGIPVALASDNTRDAFYAYGDLDVPELFRDAMRMMQLDHPVGDWPGTVLNEAAAMIGAHDRGTLATGGPADMILFAARNWSEFAARPQHDRIVLRAGQSIDTAPPEFATLDTLEGMQP